MHHPDLGGGMTIEEAKKCGQCDGCVHRTVGPGEPQCLGTQLGDAECPGPCLDPKRGTR